MQIETMAQRLRIVGIINIVFGLTFALAAYPPLNLPAMQFADLVIWPVAGAEDGTSPVARLMLAISGGVIAGLGAIWLVAGGAPCRNAPNVVRQLIIAGSVTWFIVDSTGSILAAAPVNVLGNIAYLVLLLWPVWNTRQRVQT